MSEVAAVYLPGAGASLVTLGALMALSTSLNATMFVPSRIAVMLARDGLAPSWLGAVHARTGTPVIALTITFALAAALAWSGQLSLALGIAVSALTLLYVLHSIALLALPRRNPELDAEVQVRLGPAVRTAAGLTSVITLGGILGVGFWSDLRAIAGSALADRVRDGGLTSLELLVVWAVIGTALYRLAPRRKTS
jgi:APA family basic amino acid/polyamine antiporter